MRSQYFQGDEQDGLSRELTPVTREWREQRLLLARRGLEQLASFDRGSMSDNQRLSAEIMQWQLQSLIDSEQFIDYDFPLQQMNGVNVGLINQLDVTDLTAEEIHTIGLQEVARIEEEMDRQQTAVAPVFFKCH